MATSMKVRLCTMGHAFQACLTATHGHFFAITLRWFHLLDFLLYFFFDVYMAIVSVIAGGREFTAAPVGHACGILGRALRPLHPPGRSLPRHRKRFVVHRLPGAGRRLFQFSGLLSDFLGHSTLLFSGYYTTGPRLWLRTLDSWRLRTTMFACSTFTTPTFWATVFFGLWHVAALRTAADSWVLAPPVFTSQWSR